VSAGTGGAFNAKVGAALDVNFARSQVAGVYAALEIQGYSQGGQGLIFYDAVNAVASGATDGSLPNGVWFPFPSPDRLMEKALSTMGVRVEYSTNFADAILELTIDDAVHETCEAARSCEVVYFGTPTLVGGRSLFPVECPGPGVDWWTATRERSVVRDLVGFAEASNFRRVVSGLGTGDVGLEERLSDMGDGAVVASYKNFGAFEDWVLVRDVKQQPEE